MKLLLATNPTNFNRKHLEFPAYFARLVNSGISLLSLENMTELNVPMVKYIALEGFDNPYKLELETKKSLIEKNDEQFIQAFTEMGIDCNLQRAKGIPKEETIEASRFADLLFLSDNVSFALGNEEEPTKYAEEVLIHAQCAVLVTPKNMQEINEVFFTSNGSFSSMYAIRQFTYLFPHFRDKKVTLLYVSENEDESASHKRNIKEYLHHYYSNVEFRILMGRPSEAIFSYLSKQKNCMVTFGAYGRSKISQFFKKSKANNILKTLDMPVFITHP